MGKKEDSPKKLNLKSMDIISENRNKLRNLFPGIFTESKNEKGETVESIDVEKLKAEIGEFSDLFEKRRERYGIVSAVLKMLFNSRFEHVIFFSYIFFKK
jgi:adenine-specific DNA-methyltransferase